MPEIAVTVYSGHNCSGLGHKFSSFDDVVSFIFRTVATVTVINANMATLQSEQSYSTSTTSQKLAIPEVWPEKRAVILDHSFSTASYSAKRASRQLVQQASSSPAPLHAPADFSRETVHSQKNNAANHNYRSDPFH